jgi:hypothetical protein
MVHFVSELVCSVEVCIMLPNPLPQSPGVQKQLPPGSSDMLVRDAEGEFKWALANSARCCR